MKYLYFIIGLSVFFIDRITKFYALSLNAPAYINKFLYFDLCFNRGISWGLFSSTSSITFSIVSILTILLTSFLVVYAFIKYKNHLNIIPEILIISGSISNILDRFLYTGVIDFIILHLGDYTWPAFNIADSFIVLGAILMFYYLQD